MAASSADATLAVLLAGQVRTLAEPQVLREARLNTVRSAHAAVFAHLSLEHEPAKWHSKFQSGSTSPVRAHANASAVAAWRNAFRTAFRPLYMRLASDEEVIRQGHPRWAGSLSGQPGAQSVLFFRWLLLHDELVRVERGRGSRFAFVLRLRPDAILLCKLPPDPVSVLGGYDAAQTGDAVVLMTRDAADVALAAYLHAADAWPCQLKVELCVPSLLIERRFSVGALDPGAVVVRPEAMCANDAYQKRMAEQQWLSCGRSHLGTPKPACGAAPRPWNLTARTQHWTRRRGAANHAHMARRM